MYGGQTLSKLYSWDMVWKVEVAKRGFGMSEQQSGSLRTKSIFLRMVIGQITEVEGCSFNKRGQRGSLEERY